MKLASLGLLVLARVATAFETTGARGGIDTSTGARPARTEISTFSQSGPAWHLFLLALWELQRTARSDPLSYYSIAGIHGYPQSPYDGVSGTGTYPGYCMHAAVPFSTWHRPYLALYEQAIWNWAQVLAAQYPPEFQTEYQAAATSLRIPYWDSSANPRLPDSVTTQFIPAFTPDGNQTILNPLYTFNFGAAGNGLPAEHPMAGHENTVRWWPDDGNAPGPGGNQDAATQALLANSNTILSLTYQLFANVNNFNSFSCSAPGGQPNVANNVESIHNSIHNSVSGNGFMQYPEVAAFDPIFWLHHTNVDRFLALWQALNPDSWIEPATNTYGSYFEVQGTVDSGSSPLAPFHSDGGTTMFTSDDVRSTARFGYAYPELPDWSMNATELRNHAIQQINRLYNPFMFPSRKRTVSRPLRRAANIASAFSRIGNEDAKQFGVNNANRQWFAKITIDRFAYNTSFALYFFMGDPPTDSALWPSAANLVATQGQFINADVKAMHPEGIPQGILESEVSLTHALVAGMQRGFIADLSPESVLSILQQGLQWRASAADGYEIDCLQLSGLSISVGSRSVQPAKDEYCFPVYGDIEWHGDVTQGKVGGARQYYRLAY